MRRLTWRIVGVMAASVSALAGLAHSADAESGGGHGPAVHWASQFGSAGFDVVYALDEFAGDIYGVGEVEGPLPEQDWAGSCDIVLRKYTGRGDVRWTRQFGTPACDFAEGVAATADGVYVGGTVEATLDEPSAGGFDALVRKYDEDGSLLWARQYGTAGNDSVRGAAADESGMYAVGCVRGPLPEQVHAGSADAYIRRYDGTGAEMWTRQFGTAGVDCAREVDVGPGGVVVTGEIDGDLFVRKFDAAGNDVWARQFGTAAAEIAWGIDVDGAAVYVAGDVAGALPDQQYTGGRDAFIRKYDINGNELWTRQFGTPGFDRAIRVAAEGSTVAVVGRVGGPLGAGTFAGGATDPFVRVYDADGAEASTVQFGGEAEPEAATAVTLEGEDVFVGGGTSGTVPGQTNVGYIDAFVVKLAPSSRPLSPETRR